VLYGKLRPYFRKVARASFEGVCSTDIWVLRPKREIDPGFLFYLTAQPAFTECANRSSEGTRMPRAEWGFVSNQVFPIPPLSEQRAIAHVLGTLDDKIDLNRRMNETLETMARARFKSWFVDFDPVRAKAQGRDPGLPAHLAALFPGRLVDSELGEIPEGWEVGVLEDVLSLQRGFDLPTSTRTPGPYPVMAASGPSGSHNEFMVRGPGVTTGRSGVLGNVFYVHNEFWPLNTSLWVKQFKRSTPAYAFHLLRRLDFAVFNAGSAVPTLNRNHVHTLPTLMPPLEVVHAFEAAAVTTLKRQEATDNESRTLAALRDALLPKLMSGGVRIHDGERLMGEVD
jgi:type I restriction enzyme S subunit